MGQAARLSVEPPAAPTRRQAAVIRWSGGAGAVLAAALIAVGWRAYHQPWWVYSAAESIGVSFMVAGLVAWWHRPANRLGPMMVVGGVIWYLTNLQYVGNPVLYALGYWFTYLDLVAFGHIALAYPDGRVTGRTERRLLGLAYGTYLVLQGVRYLLEGTRDPVGWQPSRYVSGWADALSWNALVFSFLLGWLVARRWWAASRPGRRLHAPVWLGVLAANAALVAGALVSLLHAGWLGRILVLVYGAALVALPFAFLSGLLRVRLARLAVADLVVELGRSAAGPARLRALLAAALQDPALVLGFASAGAQYVDPAGRPVRLPEPGDGRVATFVADGRERLAVLVHDQGLAGQPALLRAVVAAARLALLNARLQAVLQAQLAELTASRARIARAALDERRKLERDLHDGVQQRLLRLSWLAKRARSAAVASGAGPAVGPVLDELAEEARDTHSELRELAQGIHPAVIAERGLAVAVEEYVLRAPLAVTVALPRDRFGDAVEATAFFVVMEALVNAAKHAGVPRAWVRGWHRQRRLVVEIGDDGTGGADPRRGTGLRGLQDRAAALGGRLTVDSGPGRGTRIVLELPCG